MVDSVYRTRSLGVAAEGLPDQYADGKAAKVWEYYIGGKQKRTEQYRTWIVNLLRERNCQKILDVACGTGVDSIFLLEEGFDVMSTDASDKMLKFALKERWSRRKEAEFDKWVIEEANWLTLVDDLDDVPEVPEGGFDAVLCLGNSFAHLPDFEGKNLKQKIALENFRAMVKPGGILLLDHRNYDDIITTGSVPEKNVYYNSDHIVDIKCSNLYVNGHPTLTTLDYTMDISKIIQESPKNTHHFRLSYYPHLLSGFNGLVEKVFGDKKKHDIFGDFMPIGDISHPAYYIHAIQRLK
ncbi:hypothetical protein CAPTEDRAFT_99914 [Capitella teleta]|uniref:Glycine N-methyltransferase n=1 Tax=Capitella teleta TaxID=283909 RepID=R7UQ20_CAPTE|nr:hypothetical protein CAPTEDRAFT_99914 [Capitella teleta]|eukprot:ELU08594.1 hypothetical protein CAPTEDRAFT_99914 [Capitella teleta]